MKIGISDNMYSKSYGRWEDKAYEKMKSAGYEAIDYNLSASKHFVYTMNEEEAMSLLKKEKELAAKSDIVINQVHGPWRYPPRDLTEEDRSERMEKMKKSIRASHALSSPYWIVHPLMPYGLEDIKEGNSEKTWNINLEFMKELLSEAKKYGITICLENMPFEGFSISKPEEILKFVKEINDDNFKICLDTGHVAFFKELNLDEEVRRLGKYIKTFHIHDSYSEHDYHLIPYSGKIKWEEFGKALKDIEFDGVFSYETGAKSSFPDDLFEIQNEFMIKTARYIMK